MTDKTVSKVTSPGCLALRLLPTLPLFMTFFADFDEAKAACAPLAPTNGMIVTCTGTTTDQNAPDGYGTNADTGNTINVEAGASVTATNGNGLRFLSGTVNNQGTISANGANFASGIQTGSNATVNNTGTISASGAGSIGVFVDNSLTMTNTGSILGETGIRADTASTIVSSGNITGSGGTAIQLRDQSDSVTLQQGSSVLGTVNLGGGNDFLQNDGTISGSFIVNGVVSNVDGVRSTGTSTIINSGSISVGTTETAIAGNDLTVTNLKGGQLFGASLFGPTDSKGIGANIVRVDNFGTIVAAAFGIQATNTATVTNFAGAVIEAKDADGKAIQADGLAKVTNAGLIQALGTDGNAIVAGTVDLTNSGTINAPNNIAISAFNDDARVTNSGTITGRASALSVAGLADVTNAAGGIMQATSVPGQSAFTISGFDILLKNAGTVQTSGAANLNAAAFAVNNATVENSGNMLASGAGSAAVVAFGTADVRTNSGLMQQQGDGGAAIVGVESARVSNSGSIQTLGANGIAIFSPGGTTAGFADVTNSGTISATMAGGVAISAGIALGNVGSAVTVNNLSTGVISADVQAIVSNTGSADVTNAGIIQTSGDGSRAINTSTAATVDNSGTIQSTGAGSAAIFGNGLITVTNRGSGTISADVLGVGSALDEVTVQNAGTIETTSPFGGTAVRAATTATVDNLSTGTIRASGDGTAIAASIANVRNAGLVTGGFFGIDAASVNLINTGAISSDTGIRASGLNNVGSTIINSGTVAGIGGTAIKLSPAADTLTLLPGSRIIGLIDMGGGDDIINLVNNVPIVSRVSLFFRFLSANLLNIINFTGTLNATTATVDTGGMPAVQTADGVATLDPTAFGQADRALMNFTGGVSSLVRGRLGGTAANGSAVQVVSFAPTGESGRTEEAFAAISAMGYAAVRSRPLVHPFTYADAPYNVWTSGFGGTSTQKGDNTMLRSVASAGAGVIGLDRQVRPDLLIGAFAGGGAGRLSVELNSQSVDTDYVTGGFYGRFDWISHFLDFTLQGGATISKSKRLVLNDSVPGGSETATASYDGWYISPEVGYGRRYHFANGYTVTPVGRLRYLAGTFDGYNETGSVQNLVVGRRTLHDLEERAEVELSKITGVGAGSLSTSVHGGVIALQRLGNPTISTVLIGQDLSFTTPGKASTAGVVAGAGFDFRATDRMSLFGAFEATLMSDHTRTAAGKAGLKFAF